MGPSTAEQAVLAGLLASPLVARRVVQTATAARVWTAVGPVAVVVAGVLALTVRYAGLTASPVLSLAMPLSTGCLLALPVAFLPGRPRFAAAALLLFAAAILCLGDAVYTWTYGAVLPPAAIGMVGQTPSVIGGVITSLPRHAGWVFVPAIAAFAMFAFPPKLSDGHTPAPTVGRGALRMLPSASVALMTGAVGSQAVQGLMSFAERASSESAVSLRPPMEHGFLYTHGRDVAMVLVRREGKRDDAVLAARAYDAARAQRSAPHPWLGAARGKNVLLLQVESLNAWVLDAKIDGVPVMPVLAELCARSLCFDHVLDQTDAGRSSDADHLVMTSLHPLPREAVSILFPDPTVPSLPRLLSREGFTTFSSIADHPTFWNAGRRHRAYGFGESVFRPAIGDGPLLGFGLADGVFFERVAPRIAALRRPFLAWLITLSLHAPYAPLPAEFGDYRAGTLHGTPLGHYLEVARYVDTTIGALLTDLERSGVLSETLVAVYGDHGEAAGLDLDRLGDAGAKKGDMPSRVPLILAGAGLKGRWSTPAGLIDVAPTVLTLLGHAPPRSFLGRALDGSADGVSVRSDGHAFAPDVAWLRDRCVERVAGEPVEPARCDRLQRAIARELSVSAGIVRHQLGEGDW